MDIIKLVAFILGILPCVLTMGTGREYAVRRRRQHHLGQYPQQVPESGDRYPVYHPYDNDRHDEPEPDYPRQRRQDEYYKEAGPVHTFVKTDEHANFKWGVRHHVG